MTPEKKELKIGLTPEVESGVYSNLAIIAHSPNEFFIDMICVAPNTPQAKVQSRIIMTPENAKQLLMALQDNIAKYEANFGKIQMRGIPGIGGVPPMKWPGNENANN